MARDLVTGGLALALAAAYFAAADALPRSMLADRVGADGVPKALAVALGALGVLQIARTLLRRGADGGGEEGPSRHARAAGLLLIGAAYAVAAPYLGYLPATVALLFATAAYAAGQWSVRMAAVSAAGGVALWLVFAKVLGVSMPAGPIERLLG
jgi:putative tricarboxylic transport membrane protein